MAIKYFIGVDVAKQTLDATLLKEGQQQEHFVLQNNPSCIRLWMQELTQSYGIRKTNTLICLEHSGIYTAHFLALMYKRKMLIWLESSLQIKRSLGMQRGKNDRIDSFRIARYAFLHRASFRPWAKPRPEIEQLKHLTSLRARLINSYQQLRSTLREMVPFLKKAQTGAVSLHCEASMLALKEDLRKTNLAILAIIQGDQRLNRLYELVTSVDFIGPVIGTEILIVTNEFYNFSSPKKFACYCGVVPFEYSSGTSLKGKAKVSKMANRKMKSVLHFAAVASLKYPGELRAYYDRRVAEGKPKMSVINAIRNKLIHRIFVCVKEDRPFERKDTLFEREN